MAIDATDRASEAAERAFETDRLTEEYNSPYEVIPYVIFPYRAAAQKANPSFSRESATTRPPRLSGKISMNLSLSIFYPFSRFFCHFLSMRT